MLGLEAKGVHPDREHLCYVYIVIGQAGKGRSLTATAAEMRRLKATGICFQRAIPILKMAENREELNSLNQF